MIVKFKSKELKKLKEKYNLNDLQVREILKFQRVKNPSLDTEVLYTEKDGTLYVLGMPGRIKETMLKLSLKNASWGSVVNLRRFIFKVEKGKQFGNLVILYLKGLVDFEKELRENLDSVELIGWRDGGLFIGIRDSITGDIIYKTPLESFLKKNYDDFTIEEIENEYSDRETVIYKLTSDENAITDVEFKGMKEVAVNIEAFGQKLPVLYKGIMYVKALIYGRPFEVEFAIFPEKVRDYLVNYDYNNSSLLVQIGDNPPGYEETDYDRVYIPVLSKAFKQVEKENNKLVSGFVKSIEESVRTLTRNTVMNLSDESLNEFRNIIHPLYEDLKRIMYDEGLTTVYAWSEIETIIKNEISKIIYNEPEEKLKEIFSKLPDNLFLYERCSREEMIKIIKLIRGKELPKVLEEKAEWIVNNFIEKLYTYILNSQF